MPKLKLFCALVLLAPVLAWAEPSKGPLGIAQEPQPFPAVDDGEPDATLPKVLEKVNAVYPAELAGTPRPGFAWVAFVVDKSGQPKQVRAFFGSAERFEKAAEAAVRQWKMSPAIVRGRPVMTQMVVRFDFTPGEPSKAAAPAPAQ